LGRIPVRQVGGDGFQAHPLGAEGTGGNVEDAQTCDTGWLNGQVVKVVKVRISYFGFRRVFLSRLHRNRPGQQVVAALEELGRDVVGQGVSAISLIGTPCCVRRGRGTARRRLFLGHGLGRAKAPRSNARVSPDPLERIVERFAVAV